MTRDGVVALLFVALLLLVGLGIGRGLRPEVAQPAGDAEASDFRAWFWEHQTFDLLAQICLIFAGALGVAAVLPPRESSKTTASSTAPEDVHR
ncbi:MAG: hypothetical protein JXA21_03690 [Anaerolineae bacterium]|nr:hypothetical protein [Anaerolineae bacterium]